MSRRIIVMSLIPFFLTFTGCGESPDKSQSLSLAMIGSMNLYTFTSDDQHFLSNAHPYILPTDTSIKGALESLGRHLSETYFSYSKAGSESDIAFEIVNVREIQTEPNPIRIAIINMIDREEYAMGHFFQGSKLQW